MSRFHARLKKKQVFDLSKFVPENEVAKVQEIMGVAKADVSGFFEATAIEAARNPELFAQIQAHMRKQAIENAAAQMLGAEVLPKIELDKLASILSIPHEELAAASLMAEELQKRKLPITQETVKEIHDLYVVMEVMEQKAEETVGEDKEDFDEQSSFLDVAEIG